MSFVRAANPIWYLPDLIGQPLNDEYYAFFLTNTLPYLPQNVYRDPQGMTVWTGDVLRFFPNGTLPNNLYFDPNLVYRIEIRHGNSQADQLIYEINNFVPGEGASPGGNGLAIFNSENQISNPTFSIINFTSPVTFSLAGEYSVAPGWTLVLVGAGTTTLTQIILTGIEHQINNPPFALRIDSNSWTEAYLRQRFEHNGALWGAGAISMSITARAQTINETVSLLYAPNSPATTQLVATGLLTTGDYQVIQGAIDLPASDNPVLSATAYIDAIIQLPPTGIVDVSNVQAIGQSNPLPVSFDPLTDIPPYQQETEERLVDHLFHYYAQELITKPKNNILTGWNFPLNPFQFVTSVLTTAGSETQYICDQTILHQQAVSQIATGKNTIDQRENLLVQAVSGASTTKFALIQYIDSSTIQPYWSYILSAFVRARLFTVHGSVIRFKIRLIYRVDLPPTISPTEPISSWPSFDPQFSAGWTAIVPQNDPVFTMPSAYSTEESAGSNAYPGISIDQFQMPNSSAEQMTLGFVFYIIDNLNSTDGSEDAIAFDRISLIPSKFGADASPQTKDACLRECQFYYEKSYNFNVAPGTGSSSGNLYALAPVQWDGTNTNMWLPDIYFQFKQQKRAVPGMTFFSYDGTPNTIEATMKSGATHVESPADVAISDFSVIATASNCMLFTLLGTGVGASHTGFVDGGFGELLYHYVSDARLGV